MDCFQDFCIACDKQCSDGPYCSQTCRLAELEKASNSIASSPTSPSWTAKPSTFVLRPAHGFSTSTSSRSTARSQATEKTLSPSTSHSSLSSTTSSTGSSPGLSKEARAELQGYFSAFDQARESKRRSSLR